MPARLWVVKLQGTLTDGSAIALPVTARTRRLRLYKHPLKAIDFAGIAAATPLEILETGQDPVAIANLAELAQCTELAELSLSIARGTDLAPLARCTKLRALHVTGACDLGFVAKLARLESLSVSMPAAFDTGLLAKLPLRRLSLTHVTNTAIDLGWARPAFEGLSITDAPKLARLELAPLAKTGLRYLHLRDCPELTELSLYPLGGLPLEVVSVIGCGARFIDVTPLAGMASLRSLDVDGKDAPFLSARAAVASPAIRAWKAAGRLSID